MLISNTYRVWKCGRTREQRHRPRKDSVARTKSLLSITLTRKTKVSLVVAALFASVLGFVAPASAIGVLDPVIPITPIVTAIADGSGAVVTWTPPSAVAGTI
jgi:hypothetical protein